jgi:hydroxymethylpyrimidine pyrophosphatase-like HAD family hydrolase
MLFRSYGVCPSEGPKKMQSGGSASDVHATRSYFPINSPKNGHPVYLPRPPAELSLEDANILRGMAVTGSRASLLESELSFYEAYPWCLNPYLTVGATVAHLREELIRLRIVREAWQLREVMSNVFLLSCTLMNSVDDYLHGPAFGLPKKALRLPLARYAQKGLKACERSMRAPRWRRMVRINRWKQQWQIAFDAFLRLFVGEDLPEAAAVAAAGDLLASRLTLVLPRDLRGKHIRVPSAFRKQDLTQHDGLALARKFVSRFPDRRQPILIAGLRTAGAYLAPLFRAYLGREGYQQVSVVTLRPKTGLAARERAELKRCARAQYLVAIIDEPPLSCDTIRSGVELIRGAGFRAGRLVLLFPVRVVGRDWRIQPDAASFLHETALCLEPEEWRKEQLLAPKAVEGLLKEYFLRRSYLSAAVVADPAVDELNAQFFRASTENPRCRLKRVFAVRLETRDGRTELRYVLAKGVGCGWFGYSGFLAGCRLAGLVPPLLGLRDGILYSEWVPQAAAAATGAPERSHWVKRTAEYVAARANHLRLSADSTPSLGLDSQHEGYRVLAKALSRAYGSRVGARLMNGQVRRQLARLSSPFPTLIDGRMSPSEWIAGPSDLLKTDFEHHGFGKDELNVTDPAYDLADAIMRLELSPAEEQGLVAGYMERTGDRAVCDRLFMAKLLAGIWSMEWSLAGLLGQHQPNGHAAMCNAEYIRAWDFLTRMAARFCGALCHRPQAVSWRSRLVVLDIDGVLDRRIFGFPTTTAAGIRALRVLHDHGFAIAVDTARSAREVREYCAAYGFVGGVAEYGSSIYDAIADREKRVVGAEALEELDRLRDALGQMPGVFVNPTYRHSIRAHTYGRSGMAPLPEAMVPEIMYRLNLGRLRCHQTSIDTTVLAKDVDKGRGLAALLAWVGHRESETVAVGDSEPDLAMFRVAKQCFAPGRVGRSDLIRALGGSIAPQPFQRGLLAIARTLAHPDGSVCGNCPSGEIDACPHDRLFLKLLEAADARPSIALLRALLDPRTLQVLVQS